jgi:hypothetical protein
MESAPLSTVSSDDVFTDNAGVKQAALGKEKLDNQPIGLPFRSYQTGTLKTDNFDPSLSASAGQALPPTMSKKKLSGASPAFVPANRKQFNSSPKSVGQTSVTGLSSQSSPSGYSYKQSSSAFTTPTKVASTVVTTPSTTGYYRSGSPVKAPRSFLTRADKSKKDIIITSSSITHNIVRITEKQLPTGFPYQHRSEEFNPEKYNVVDVVSKMDIKERKDFWEKNWIEIIVDLDEFTDASDSSKVENKSQGLVVKKQNPIVAMMDKFGPEFYEYAHTVFITICIPASMSTSDANTNKTTTASFTKAQQESGPFQAIQSLVTALHQFTQLTHLSIILRTPSNARTPLSLSQLNLALPFYELAFTDWDLRWQTSYMSRSEQVRGWPITYLDKERQKMDRMAEMELQEVVFRRVSRAPMVHHLPFLPRVEKALI